MIFVFHPARNIPGGLGGSAPQLVDARKRGETKGTP